MSIKEKNGFEITLDKGASVENDAVHVVPQSRPYASLPPAPPVHHSIVPVAEPLEGKTESAIDPKKCITSPMVGTFYKAESPESPAFVKVGDLVNKGDAICIIEAMKVMNEVKSDRQGKITKILVDDGSPVEYGQTLFVVE